MYTNVCRNRRFSTRDCTRHEHRRTATRDVRDCPINRPFVKHSIGGRTVEVHSPTRFPKQVVVPQHVAWDGPDGTGQIRAGNASGMEGISGQGQDQLMLCIRLPRVVYSTASKSLFVSRNVDTPPLAVLPLLDRNSDDALGSV